jgi:hypothetical protein
MNGSPCRIIAGETFKEAVCADAVIISEKRIIINKKIDIMVFFIISFL